MFDIGIGEIIVLAVIGLLIFGPERLPKAAADAARMLKQVRSMAAGARKELSDSAGLDLSEAKDAFSSLADLHPRRIMQSVLTDDEEAEQPKKPSAPAAGKRSDSTAGKRSDSTAGKRSDSAAGANPTFDPDAT